MASEDVKASESAVEKIVNLAEEAKLARQEIRPTSHAVISICKSLVAGGVAGGVSRTAVAPLERLKILLQVQNSHSIKYNGTISGLKYIWRTEGFKGLFKGNGTNCARIVPNSAVKFFSYEQASKGILYLYQQQTGNEDAQLTPLLRLGAGACAGIIAMSATYPMDMVRGRITVQTEKSPYQYRGMVHALSTILREEGPRALYKGWLPSVIGVIPYVGLNFAVYESLKEWLVKTKPLGLVDDSTELGVVTRLGCGAVAGTMGQTVAYPLDVVRRRMQMVGWKDAASIITGDGRSKASVEYSGMIDTFLERVQPSSDHVPHRYLLAEAGDTLFASFIGTKQYKDVMADVNIFQGALFHEDAVEDIHGLEPIESGQVDTQRSNRESHYKISKSKTRPSNLTQKPAAHRGFMARAKGIPALELYRLAQKKKRRLVLCGHSLGGAVAVLATLAILRVFAASSKDNEKVQVKCITFSQPPVGNAALRDYVNEKGWQQYFKTYCIPEDLVPRILSPAYFHHYNARPLPIPSDGGASVSMSKSSELSLLKQKIEKPKDDEREQLVLGVGPVQNSFWRLSRLVPLEGVRKQLYRYRGKKVEPLETPTDSDSIASVNDIADTPQSLEIQEGSDGISLRLLPTDQDILGEGNQGKSVAESNINNGDKRGWRRMPYLPLYVPFGQLYLLENSSVEFLSGAEYSKLTSVRSVLAEVKERFQSHSMKSYRFRFQRIYELCMSDDTIPFLGIEQVQQFPQLQKWLGISVGGTVDLGHIVESPVIRTATSLVPLGWSGIPSGKNTDPFKVDISGFGLHLCTLVEARVNGRWCSTSVESFPSPPVHSPDHGEQSEVQNMRVLVGGPLKRPPKHHMVEDIPMFSSIDSSYIDTKLKQNVFKVEGRNLVLPDGLDDFVIYCTTDFSTVWKEVNLRTRRVKLIGLEGSGKTSLLKAILDRGRRAHTKSIENLNADDDVQEGIAGGLCYSDSAGVNLQNLNMEATHFRDDLWKGIRDLCKKTDLIILVHNLSHKIPRYNDSNALQPQPAMCLLLNEAKSLGIPWILAITNKFSVSAHQQKVAINAVVKAYQASPSTTEVVNSCPYVTSSAAGASQSWYTEGKDPEWMFGAQKLIFAPLELVRRPFQKKTAVLPIDGVSALCELVHRVLRSQEEAALLEFARDRLFVELARERAVEIQDSQTKVNPLNAAAVGASLGAGLGLVLAVVMGAASALRKP